MRCLVFVPVLAAALCAFAACSNTADLSIDPSCNPLGLSHCAVPWPSSAFEVADPSTATGRRLQIPATTLPTNDFHTTVDPTAWNEADGFSPAAPMIMAFPGGVSATGLPPNDDYDSSTTTDSATVILDMTTMQLVPHFAEIDMQATATPDSQALFLRPAARLIGGHRYAAAITKKVKAADGSELPIPPGFTALVNHQQTNHPLLEAMRPRFGDVLSALATAGFPADQLVVAWDFTVASDAFIHSDMIATRDRTLAALSSHTIAYTITSDAPIGDGSGIQRRIEGTLDAPLFLSNGGGTTPGTVMVRDAQGLPVVQGFYQIPFVATVPACAYTATQPVGMVIYGHGLLGSCDETADGVQQTTAIELCRVFVGTDMRGLATVDLPAVAAALNDASTAAEVMEKLEQGIANHVTLVQAMRTTFASTLFVDGAGKSLVDPTNVVYFGLSQGAIMGTSVMAYEPTITRAVLGVGGANYSMLLERSSDWTMYRTVLNGAYPDAMDDTLLLNLYQMRWDKVEGSGIANTVLTGTATSTPPKQLLMQIALGDDQVPNLGSYWQARTMGIPVLSPTTFQPWGLTTMASPLPAGASALVIEDGGVAPPPATNVPAPSTGQHDLTRNQPASRRQMADFYDTGMIVNECGGGSAACTCATGACN
jgi:hypothetical protein